MCSELVALAALKICENLQSADFGPSGRGLKNGNKTESVWYQSAAEWVHCDRNHHLHAQKYTQKCETLALGVQTEPHKSEQI